MTKQHFSPKEVFMFGWSKTKQHAWFLALTFIIASIVSSAVAHVHLISAIVNIMVTLSVTSISIVIARNHDFTFKDLYTPLLSARRVLKFAALSVLYGFFTTVGFSLVALMGNNPVAVLSALVILVLPGLFVAVRFLFYPYIVIEHDHASLADLIKMSYKMTQGHFWMLTAFLLLIVGINLIGAMLFIVGLAVSIPVSIFAVAHMYNRFKDHQML